MLKLICCFPLGIGVYLILLDSFKLPYRKTSKAALNLLRRQKGSVSVLENGLESISVRLSKHLRINEFNYAKIESDLLSANSELSPERHIANALVKAAVIGIFSIPLYAVSPWLSLFIIIAAVYTYKRSLNLDGKIKEKRRHIEYELPRLVSCIEKNLKHSRDILYMLESYAEDAGAELKRELNITIADMRSGNYERALTRLEARVGSAMMSDVCRGLISVLRGDETEVYWATLSINFADAQKQMLKLEAQKIPGKVHRLSTVLFMCFLGIYLVVIIASVITSLGVLFN